MSLCPWTLGEEGTEAGGKGLERGLQYALGEYPLCWAVSKKKDAGDIADQPGWAHR
jgi:hypothetical protein